MTGTAESAEVIVPEIVAGIDQEIVAEIVPEIEQVITPDEVVIATAGVRVLMSSEETSQTAAVGATLMDLTNTPRSRQSASAVWAETKLRA